MSDYEAMTTAEANKEYYESLEPSCATCDKHFSDSDQEALFSCGHCCKLFCEEHMANTSPLLSEDWLCDACDLDGLWEDAPTTPEQARAFLQRCQDRLIVDSQEYSNWIGDPLTSAIGILRWAIYETRFSK